MECLRCGNTEDHYFYDDKGTYYCRKCIAFGRIDVGSLPKKRRYKTTKWEGEIQLTYPLTSAQKVVVTKLLRYLQQGKDVLVYAAAGAGKTEIAMEAIAMYLRKGEKVGMAIARRQVVLEIQERLQKAFPSLKVIAVCEGHTTITDGDIIVCTMHQLHRYYQSFSLLIMDEVDAFPYRGNAVLKQIAMHACKKEKVYLTATPDEEMLKDVKDQRLQMVELFMRPHGKPLVVPTIVKGWRWVQWLQLVKVLQKHKQEKKQLLVFVPTIALAKQMHRVLRLMYKCAPCTSQTEEKDQIINDFKQQKYVFLLCTTILERGITIPNIDVVVFASDHQVFNEASLIQIIGRVGRTMACPSGEAILYCQKKTEAIVHCRRAITYMNASLQQGKEA